MPQEHSNDSTQTNDLAQTSEDIQQANYNVAREKVEASADAEQPAADVDDASYDAPKSADSLENLVTEAEGKKPMSGREKALCGVAAVAVVAAIAGFGLFAANLPGDAAAKYDGGKVTESEVSAYIEQYRSAYSLSDDTAFAAALKNQSMTVASYRQSAIDQLIIQKIIEKRASELGVSVSDDEVEARIQEVYGQIANGDDSIWQSTLESMGVTEDDLRTRYRADILQSKVCEQDVPQKEASDSDTLTYLTSYLADTTQKHVYRIVFTSDDGKSTKADECTQELKKLKKAGKLDTAAFEELAVKYSESDTVADDKGSLGWTGSGSIGDTISNLIGDMAVGSYSDATTVSEDDDALEIVYVDQDFTFPSSSKITSIDSLNVPDELLDAIKAAVSKSNWQSDSSSYVARLLATAKVTYYPVPDDASYNVNLSEDEQESADSTDESADTSSDSDDSSESSDSDDSGDSSEE